MFWLVVLGCRGGDGVGGKGEETTPLTEAPPDVARVVVAVMDGVRVEECVGDGVHPSVNGEAAESFTPEIHAGILPEAAVVRGARNIGVTTTYDAHVELVSGLRQPLVTFPTGESGLWRSEAPTLFELVREAGGLTADQALLIGNTPLIEEVGWSLWPGLGERVGATWRFRTDAESQDLSDPQAVEDVIGWMSAHDTRLVVVNLHRMDLAGHVEPGTSYLDRIRQADPAVARLWNWLQATPPYADHTTLIVLADHGRHRSDEPDAWKNHGDQCSGCRDIPLFVAGPGIVPGDYDIDATIADVAATAARALDLSLPLGRGRALTELYGLPGSVDDRFGAIAAVEGGYVVEVGPGLVGDGVALPTAGVRAEAPVLLQTSGGLMGCWRELGPDGAWIARCALDGRDTAFAPGEGSANWQGALAADPDGAGAWLAWVHNPSGDAGASLVRPRIAFWDGVGWQTDATSPPEVSYPTRPSLARASGGALRLAAATSDGEPTGRDSRSVTVWEVAPADTWALQSWRPLLQLRPDAAYPRLDRPALRPDGGALAYLGLSPSGAATVLLRGDPASPGDPAPVGQNAIPLLGLHWWSQNGDWSLVWAQMGADGIEIVRWNGSVHVYPTGLPWISSMAMTQAGALLSTEGGVEEVKF